MGELSRSKRSDMAKKGQGNRSPSSRSASTRKANRTRKKPGRKMASKRATAVMIAAGNFPSRNARRRRGGA